MEVSPASGFYAAMKCPPISISLSTFLLHPPLSLRTEEVMRGNFKKHSDLLGLESQFYGVRIGLCLDTGDGSQTMHMNLAITKVYTYDW